MKCVCMHRSSGDYLRNTPTPFKIISLPCSCLILAVFSTSSKSPSTLLSLLLLQPAEGGGLKLSFQLTLSENRRQTTHVAFCYPFTYSDCQKMLSKLETKHSSLFLPSLRNVITVEHVYYIILQGASQL